MKTRVLFCLLSTVIVFLISGCPVKPDEQAQALYAEASRQLQSNNAKTASYAAALAAYRTAKNNIERLLAEYPSSPIVAGLRSGQAKIAGYTLSRFNGLETELKPLAEAEHDPLATALIIAQAAELPTISKRDSAEKWFYPKGKGRTLAKIAKRYAQTGDTDHALAIAKTIEYQYARSDALVAVADRYAETGQTKTAERSLDVALANARMEEDQWLPGTLDTFVKTGHLDQALAVAKAIENAKWRAKGMSTVAGEYAKAGQFEDALVIARSIEDNEVKDQTLAAIAERLAEAGELNKAIDLSHTIEEEDVQADTLIAITEKYAGIEQLKQVLDIVRSRKSEYSKYYQTQTLAYIAARYAKLGQAEEARAFISQALETAETIDDKYSKARGWYAISSAYNNVGEKEKSRELASQAYDLAPYAFHGMRMDDDAEQLLTAIAGEYAKIGQLRRGLELALSIGGVCGQGYVQLDELDTIVGRFVKAGELQQAYEITQCRQCEESIGGCSSDNWYPKLHTFKAIAAAHLKAGQFAQALDVFKTILNYENTILPNHSYYEQDVEERNNEILAAFVENYSEPHPFTHAQKIIKLFTAKTSKAEALAFIAERYAKAGQTQKAAQFFSKARHLALAIADKDKKTEVLDAIKAHYANSGQLVKASEIAQTIENKHATKPSSIEQYIASGQFTQALEIIQLIENKLSQAGFLTSISDQAIKAGYQFTENDKAILRAIVQSAIPLSTLWRPAAASASTN